jgi:DNA/RNA endonuclease G (NUC1)
VVPEWGTLRFNLHVPDLSGGNLKVSLEGENGHKIEETIHLLEANGPYDLGYNDADTYRIGYGITGFETFHVDVPESLRGQVATVKFEIEEGTVYLDDVFFKSLHTKLGNPTFARHDADTHRENYLIEKPQYALSYNDATKTPNWVSWQLNNTWLGNVRRPGSAGTVPPGYPPAGFPDGTYPADKLDYPWLGDRDLPDSWVRTEGPDYRFNQRGMERGHMVPVADRNRTSKDVYSTFLTSNMLPQHGNGNNRGAWQSFERDIRASIENSGVARDYYIIAGGYGYDPNRAIGNQVSVHPDGHTVLDPNGTWTVNPKGILIPEFTWKIVVPLVPGQSIGDIPANTEVVTIMVPNRDSLVTPRNFPLPGETNRTITNWNNWRDWRVSINYLENLTGYNFLSELPQNIQEAIESRDNGLLPS